MAEKIRFTPIIPEKPQNEYITKVRKEIPEFRNLSDEEITNHITQIRPDLADKLDTQQKINFTPANASNIPDTFWGGVRKSLTPFGESDQAALKGGVGYLKGATVDIPSSFMGMLHAIGNPSEAIQNLRNLPHNLYQTTMMAGSKPEEFGRTVGQITGQPLVTAGIGSNIRPGIGVPMENIGRAMSESQPISGILPRFTSMKTVKLLEKELGPRLETTGARISGRGLKSGIPGTARASAISANEPQSITLNPKPGFDWTTPESNYYEGSRGYTVNEPGSMTVNPPPEAQWQMPENVTQSDVPLGIDKSIPTQTLDMRAQPTTNWLGYTDVAQPTGIDWARLRRIFDLKRD